MSTAHQDYAFRIDTERCSGHGRCYALAPESFVADESGYGTPTGRVETDKQPADLRFIVDSCPEEAISIVPADRS
jgi:ferredoxin